MRISIIMLFCFIGMMTANESYAQNTLLNIEMKNSTVEEVLDEIEKNTEYKFFYNTRYVDVKRRVTLSAHKEDVFKVLDKIFSNTNISYRVVDKDVILTVTGSESADNIQQDERRITGRVLDENKDPVIGATVVVKGNTSGTITGMDGNFSLPVPQNMAIEVAFMGYKTVEIIPTAGQPVIVTLQEDAELLDEVVVVGYSTRKRANLTGAVATVSSEVMQAKPVNNPLSALQGEIPGMLIQRGSGSPGDEKFTMSVRGASTINGDSEPLVIIDGVAGNINMLNSDDIESISVLKDAQAAIYGARASGGVFLVTTKSGKRGKPKIQYSGNYAITKSAGMMKSPTTYQMAIMDNEANIHNGAAPMYTEDYLNRIKNNDPNPIPHPLYGGWMLFFTNTDWMKEVLENGSQQKHNVNISGGGDNSNFYLSTGYVDQQGVVKHAKDNNKRYNLRLNYDYFFFDRVKLETKVAYEHQKQTGIGGVGDWVIGEAIFGMPNHPVYNASGNYFAQGGWSNAVAFAKEGATATNKTTNLNTNFKLIGDIYDGLKLVLQAGITKTWISSKDPARSVPLYTWDNDIAYYAIANPDEANLEQVSAETQYRNYTAYLQYNKTFAGKHDIDMMFGAAHEENNYDTFSAWRDGFRYDGLWDLQLGNTNNMRNSGGGTHWSIDSYFGRIGYVFNEKYLVESNFRYDGSSRFSGAESRWGFFPGVSAGWRISKENFMKEVDFINELKVRASYGETGNQEGIQLYDFVQKIKPRTGEWDKILVYPFGPGSNTQSAVLDGMVARNRKWETIVNKNIGIDVTMLNNRLDFSFDYFWKRNKDMLIPVTYPSLLGAKPSYSNSGELKTWGFEASIGWKDKVGPVEYFTRFVISDAKNEVTDYGGGDTYVLGHNRVREGYPLNSYFAYEFDGLIRTQAELDEYKKLEGVPSDIGIGDAKFKDLNNDGKISTYGTDDDGDVKYVGNSTPRYNYGITAGAAVKGFDFSVFFQGVGKRTLFRTGDYAMPWSDWWRQPTQYYYQKTWNEDRQNAYYPRLSHGDIRHWNYQESTMQKINAAYIRLKNIQVGYTLPTALTNKVSIAKARIYFSGQDLWEHHNVKGGWDPESAAWGGNYPFQRYYSFGIDITF